MHLSYKHKNDEISNFISICVCSFFSPKDINVLHLVSLSILYIYSLTLMKLPVGKNRTKSENSRGTLSKVSVRRRASAGIIRFVCRGSSAGRTEQFRNRINLLSPIGCPRHYRDARKFFILLSFAPFASLRPRLSRAFEKKGALVDCSFL